ncbi:MAG: ribosome hibernation-promoting factor, HPF/YfiA family [Eubacterium sp.]|jgi:putative sigma-54 modulation protein
MKTIITGKNYTPDRHLEDTIQKKLEKLGKYFSDDIDAKVYLSQERGRVKTEVNINAKGALFRTEVLASDAYEGIDIAVDKLSSQMSKFKGKLQARYQNNKSVRFEAIPQAEETQTGKIVRTKKLALTPMAPDEAVLQMEMSGHNFYAFVDSKTETVSIAYKRNDGNYGILETD